jgi:hypothetical protein
MAAPTIAPTILKGKVTIAVTTLAEVLLAALPPEVEAQPPANTRTTRSKQIFLFIMLFP